MNLTKNAVSIEEVYNIPFSPLVTTLFSTQWTFDNHISVITEKGVHVFELIPSPMSPQPNIKFSRSFIYPSDVLPTLPFVDEINSCMRTMKRREIYSMLMKSSLTPKASEITDAVPKIVNVCWSPVNLMHSNKSALAIITSIGAVELLHKVSTDWFSVCNISSLWLNSIQDTIQSNLKGCTNKNLKFSVINKNLIRLQACAITWSELFKMNQIYAFFTTAFRSSEIVVWKIPRVSSSAEDVKAIIMSNINLNTDVKINILHWITIQPHMYLIIIGYFDGQIQGLIYETNTDSFINKSIEKYYTYTDHIPVSSLHTVCQNENDIKFVASKNFFLFLFCLNREGKLINTHYLQIEGFSISGITVVSSECILITTQNSKIHAFNIQNKKLQSMKMEHNLPEAHIQYLGLVCSPNRAMLAVVTSPSSTYDHLVTREPSTLHILSLIEGKWNPFNILNKSKESDLSLPWDYLELIRLKAAKAVDPMNVLPDIPQNLESLQLYDLRMCMWLSVMTEVLQKRKVIQGIKSITGEIAEAQPLIFIHSACSYLYCLVKKKDLSKDEELSINLLRLYLEVYLAGEDNEEETFTSKLAREALKETSHLNSGVIEVCNFCQRAIDELSWNVMKCPAGHKLPRCALSLLQITTVEYRSCSICGQLYHLCLDKEYEEMRCIFCNVPALYDSRIFSEKDSKLCTRNLSKPKINSAELLKNQDSDAREYLDE